MDVVARRATYCGRASPKPLVSFSIGGDTGVDKATFGRTKYLNSEHVLPPSFDEEKISIGNARTTLTQVNIMHQRLG
jgi:hypothetical protein